MVTINNKDEFYHHAVGFAYKFIANINKPFSSEDLKEEFEKEYECNFDKRLWGVVFKKLSEEGKIHFLRYQKYKSFLGHKRPSTVWITTQYKEKQSKNRKANGYTQQSIFDG